MTRLLLAAASAAALAGCAPGMMTPYGMAPAPGAPYAAPTPMPTDAATYGRMAAASDLFEIQSGQMAMQASMNPDVRGFGRMLVDHHAMTTNELTRAARAAGMQPPPPMLDARKQAMLDQLRGTPAGSFDAVFLQMQMTAHQEALALHSTYAASGDVPALRAAAARAVPIVRQHLEQATAMHHRGM
jgi:putative membrane protein